MPRSLAAMLIAIACLPTITALADSITVRDPDKYVVDRANRLDLATKTRLESLLKDLQDKTTAQLKVLVVDTTGDEDIFAFSQRHALLWRLGQKEKSNGALIVLAVNDRKVRVQTGKGLEGALPDSWIGTTSRAVSQRYFKAGNYSAGIEELARLTALRVAEDAGVELKGVPQPVNQPLPDTRWSPGLLFIVIFVIILVFIARNGRRRRSRYRRTWGGPFFGGIGGLPSGGWSSGGWGSSSGGGWSGGFSGGGSSSLGGGGDFGGGGGGASW